MNTWGNNRQRTSYNYGNYTYLAYYALQQHYSTKFSQFSSSHTPATHCSQLFISDINILKSSKTVPGPSVDVYFVFSHFALENFALYQE